MNIYSNRKSTTSITKYRRYIYSKILLLLFIYLHTTNTNSSSNTNTNTNVTYIVYYSSAADGLTNAGEELLPSRMLILCEIDCLCTM
jgi:hypothetical protein